MTVKVGVDEILPVRGVTGRLQVVQNVVVNRRDLRGSVGNGIGEGIVERNLRSAEDSLDVLRESVHVRHGHIGSKTHTDLSKSDLSSRFSRPFEDFVGWW